MQQAGEARALDNNLHYLIIIWIERVNVNLMRQNWAVLTKISQLHILKKKKLNVYATRFNIGLWK